MANSKLIVMVGIPGSGKSTFAKHYLEQSEPNSTVWVSRDIIRFSLVSEEEDYFSKENEVFNLFVRGINAGLKDGMTVIADATHLNAKSRKKLLSHITVPDVYLEACVMETSLEECLTNNAKRTGRACVPENSIISMYKNFEYPTFKEGFKTISTVKGKI